MLVKTFCAAVTGLEATTITIEVNISRGVMFHLSGMADTAVRESYDRIQVALPHVGFKVPVSCPWPSASLPPTATSRPTT